MPTRAEELFQQFIDRGETLIDEFIAQGTTEELFLDFKRSATNGEGKSLDTKDRNNFAKAISGFGNSEGGVIVWGVDCRENKEGADLPEKTVPLINPPRFKSWLEGAASGLTVPPHGSVRHHAVVGSDGKSGFVATLIPKSDHAPHQTTTDSRYMMRAGSNFLPVPHSVLAGMFGRRPQPRVIHQFLTDKATVGPGQTLGLQIGIMLVNSGAGIAEQMYLNLNVWSSPCEIEFNNPDADRWDGNFGFGRIWNLISKDGVRLAPGARIMPISMTMTFKLPFTERLSIDGQCGAAGAETLPIKMEASAESLTESYKAYLDAAPGEGEQESLRRKFVETVVGKPWRD